MRPSPSASPASSSAAGASVAASSTGAPGLSARSAASSAPSPDPARSRLETAMRSAIATCRRASACRSSVATPSTASTSVATPSSRIAAPREGCAMIARSTGAGSASPVVSMTIRSMRASRRWRSIGREPSSRRSSVSTRSPRTVQHRQPSDSSITSSPDASISAWSSPMAPNSFTITAVRCSAGSRSSRLSSVVLPAPRNPVRTVTGIGLIG